MSDDVGVGENADSGLRRLERASHSRWARQYTAERDVCTCGTVGSSCPVHGEWQ